MKSNREIRRVAREKLKGGWFGRVMTVGCVLYSIVLFVMGALAGGFRACNIQTWDAFLQAKLMAMRSGLDYVAPSPQILYSMTGASLFHQFICSLFGAIVLFGLATVLLKAFRDEHESWFSASFGGFARPFECFWLVLVMNVRIFLWSLLFFVPGLIAIYRYRAAWYVKCENPDWGAGKCLAESGRLMAGHKWQAVSQDAWFFMLIALVTLVSVLVALPTANLFKLLGSFVGSLGSILLAFILFWLWMWVLIYLLMARAVFYTETKTDCKTEEESHDSN